MPTNFRKSLPPEFLKSIRHPTIKILRKKFKKKFGIMLFVLYLCINKKQHNENKHYLHKGVYSRETFY